jgi:hypothetical protein
MEVAIIDCISSVGSMTKRKLKYQDIDVRSVIFEQAEDMKQATR